MTSLWKGTERKGERESERALCWCGATLQDSDVQIFVFAVVVVVVVIIVVTHLLLLCCLFLFSCCSQ